MLSPVALPDTVYRVARVPVWGWPEWAFAGDDGTFGNRFDDPASLYRVLYASASRYGCFLETLARFRPDLNLYAELQEIEGSDDFVPPGIVPATWLLDRYVGSASANGTHADIGTSESIAHVRTALAGEAVSLNLSDVDATALYITAPRHFTHLVSREVYRQGFDGIRYLSKYGNDVVNFAMFEGRVFFSEERETVVSHDDGELSAALRVHNLALESSTTNAIEVS